MASQEHSEASGASKEEHVLSTVDLNATTPKPITDKSASDEIYKTIRHSPKARQDTMLTPTDASIRSDRDYAIDDEQIDWQDELDIERTMKVPKNTLISIYQTVVPNTAPIANHAINLPEIEIFHNVDVNTLPLYQDKKPRSIDAGLQYRCTIQSKRRRFKLRGALITLVSILIFIAGTLGVLYYSGVHFGGSTVATAVLPAVSTPDALNSAAKTLSVQSGTIVGFQGISTQQTVYIDAQRHIQLLASADGRTWQQADLTHLTAAPVAQGTGLTSYSWMKGGRQEIAYLDALGHIHLMSSGATGHWQVLDLTQRASAPLSGGTALVGYQWLQTGSQQIIYIDQAQHIQELESADGNNWHVADITNLTHATASDGTALTAFIWTRAAEEHIVYVDKDQHVVDLSTTPSGNWQSIDLSQTYSAPLANGNVIVGYEWGVNGTMQIDYIDSRNHIQELSDSLQGKWTLSDVTATTNSPVTNGQALAGNDWIQGGARILLYIDGNKHIQELSQLPQENWNEADLTQLTSSPLANTTGLVAYTWSVNGSEQVVFVDATHHLRALSDIANATWRKVNW